MQSRKNSLLEQILNVGSGFFISLILMGAIVAPLYNLETNTSENFGITCIFTIASIVRGYLWRRFFNKRLQLLQTPP